MLGRFEVFVDSRPVPAEAWAQRRATDLVKLLALAPGHRMPRDEVLEMLWPKLGADAAASNLHKAASYARRALGDRGAVVLRGGVVELAPAAEVITDVERFERGDDSAYGGELLPDEPYAGVDARPARAAARAPPRGDALPGPLGGGAARGPRRRGGSPRAHAPSAWRAATGRLPRASSGCCARSSRGSARSPRRRRWRYSASSRAVRRCARPGSSTRPSKGGSESSPRRSARCGAPRPADGGALLVTGPMGIGKTRLLEAVLAEAEELGFHTLRGAAHEAEGRTPYAPLVEALDPLAERRPELIGALTDSAQVALSRLLPSVRRPAGRRRKPWIAVASSRAVAELLGQAASERGVVLVIDDLNAADEATVALVHHLARSAAGERMLVVAAMRDEPLPEAAALVRSSLLGRGAAVELALGPLDRTALAAVAERAAGRPLRAENPRCHRALGGGQPVLRRGAGGVGGRLRRGHGVAAAARGRRRSDSSGSSGSASGCLRRSP